MAAEHPLDMKLFRVTSDGIFVGADEADSVFHARFDRFAKRPVTKAKDAPDKIHEGIEGEEELITDVAEKGKPSHILHHGIQLVPVQDENAPPIGGEMDRMLLNRYRAVGTEMAREKLIVISWNIDDTRPFARFAEQLLNDVVVLLRPINATSQRPDVDQVANDIERVELVLL